MVAFQIVIYTLICLNNNYPKNYISKGSMKTTIKFMCSQSEYGMKNTHNKTMYSWIDKLLQQSLKSKGKFISKQQSSIKCTSGKTVINSPRTIHSGFVNRYHIFSYFSQFTVIRFLKELYRAQWEIDL